MNTEKRSLTLSRPTMVWLCLMVLVGIAAATGADSDGAKWHSQGLMLCSLSVAILIIKGQLIVDYFMALRHVTLFWRLILSAYCLVIGSIILFVYWLGL